MSETTPTWAEIVAWADSEIAQAVADIQTVGMSHEDTERVRVRIAVLRDLKAMTKIPASQQFPPTPNY